MEVGALLKRLQSSRLQEAAFPKSPCIFLDGVSGREIVCVPALPLTNEPYHPGSSALSLTQLTGLGSFMKNKLIMHTKLHLQETFRCILQSSKMIRFTFCSRRLVTPSSRRVLNCRVCQGSPSAAGCPVRSRSQGLAGLSSQPHGALFGLAAGGGGTPTPMER